ncbi:TetR/AcrR family transcriptional regulator [Clostridium sp.]|uniref:TetR/AcrR family transcriptional regulator n=1 Tax=Clostridium sp. TaxID=1506 RepID=UPI002FCAC007
MTKRYNSNQTIDNIISVSSKLFLEKGFEKTSMQDIASTAGISKGAIYHHFNSKTEIISAVMENQKDTIAKSLDSWLDESTSLTGREKLISILEKNIESQEAHYLDNALKTQVKSSEFIVSYMQNCINESAPIFSKIIKEGVEDGSIITEYPDECAEVFFLLINIWCDPVVFKCDSNKLIKRLKFLQSLMRNLGVDIVSDEIVLKTNDLLNKIY